MFPYDIGHIRWSALMEAVTQPPCKAIRTEVHQGSDVPARVHIYFPPRHQEVPSLTDVERVTAVLRKALLRHSIVSSDVDMAHATLYVACDDLLTSTGDSITVSFMDFHGTQGSASTAPILPTLSKLPSFVEIPPQCPPGGVAACNTHATIRIFREERRLSQNQYDCHASSFSTTQGNPSGNVLVVGAGGIGCELLKSIALAGLRRITVVDLDTVDATNLNRQFLFRQAHIDSPKSTVAAEVMTERILRGCAITSLCCNVKDPSPMDHTFYSAFDVVLNGLDNMSARKHVNRMCIAANVPLLESGTMGFNGQVQPIVPHVTECYDCRPKPSDKPSFAVCTIHAKPTSIVHCVHYAKELFDQLAESVTSMRSSQRAGDHDAHIAQPKSEMDFAKDFVEDAVNGAGECGAAVAGATPIAVKLFELLFVTKIQQLLDLKREAPWPVSPPIMLGEHTRAVVDAPCEVINLLTALLAVDARTPTTAECACLFGHAISRLVLCWQRSESSATFDKHDNLAVTFVAATANLRATCFHIETQPLEALRSIAGNIVPAIASSNAIIAACLAAEATTLLLSRSSKDPSLATRLQFVYLRKAPLLRRVALCHDASQKKYGRRHLLLHANPLECCNPQCLVCSPDAANIMHHITLNASLHTVGTFVNLLLRGYYAMISPCLALGAKVLFEDEEFENLANRPLTDFLSGQVTKFSASDLLLVERLEDFQA
jgi:ubiquitin-like 1-activating enzyme E1 B